MATRRRRTIHMAVAGLVAAAVALPAAPVAALPDESSLDWDLLTWPGVEDWAAEPPNVDMDGDTVAIAYPAADPDDITDAGEIRVHRRDDDGWTSYSVLEPGGPVEGSEFGQWAMVVHGDRMVVGVDDHQLHEFVLGDTGATHVATHTVPTAYGFAVALSDDMIVVGNRHDQYYHNQELNRLRTRGSVTVLHGAPGDPRTVQTLTRPAHATDGDTFGQQVAIVRDDIVVVGAALEGGAAREVWVLHDEGDADYSPQRLPELPSDGSSSPFYTASMAADRDTIVVAERSAELVLYRRPGDGAGWVQSTVDYPDGDTTDYMDLDVGGRRVSVAKRSAYHRYVLEQVDGSWRAHEIGGDRFPQDTNFFPTAVTVGGYAGVVREGVWVATWPEVPEAPLDFQVTASPTVRGRADLSWRAPPWEGASPITSYTVSTYRLDAWEPVRFETLPPTARSTTFDLLSDDARYVVGIVARNAEGNSRPAEVELHTPTTPGAPRDVAVAAGLTARTVSWEAPEDDGRAPVLRYEVLRDDVPVATVSASARSWTDSSALLIGTHVYEVRAANVVGTGPGASACSRGLLGDDC